MRTFVLVVGLALTLHASGLAERVRPTITVFDNRFSFVAAAGPHLVATFEDVPAGTWQPLVSNGVLISGFEEEQFGSFARVLDDTGDHRHGFWFPDAGSPPNWLDTGISFRATFPHDVMAAGFDFTCVACDFVANDTRLEWTLFESDGSVLASGDALYDFSAWHYDITRSFGISSDVPFRSIGLTRGSVSQPHGGGNWFLDDLRYSTPAVVVFGPALFDRDMGEPRPVVVPFTVADPNATYLLRIDNENASAVVAINGVTVVRHGELVPSVDRLFRTVHLTSANQLAVTVLGRPDGRVTVQILRR